MPLCGRQKYAISYVRYQIQKIKLFPLWEMGGAEASDSNVIKTCIIFILIKQVYIQLLLNIFKDKLIKFEHKAHKPECKNALWFPWLHYKWEGCSLPMWIFQGLSFCQAMVLQSLSHSFVLRYETSIPYIRDPFMPTKISIQLLFLQSIVYKIFSLTSDDVK